MTDTTKRDAPDEAREPSVKKPYRPPRFCFGCDLAAAGGWALSAANQGAARSKSFVFCLAYESL